MVSAAAVYHEMVAVKSWNIVPSKCVFFACFGGSRRRENKKAPQTYKLTKNSKPSASERARDLCSPSRTNCIERTIRKQIRSAATTVLVKVHIKEFHSSFKCYHFIPWEAFWSARGSCLLNFTAVYLGSLINYHRENDSVVGNRFPTGGSSSSKTSHVHVGRRRISCSHARSHMHESYTAISHWN